MFQKEKLRTTPHFTCEPNEHERIQIFKTKNGNFFNK